MIDKFYPNYVDQVKDLKEIYQIDEYNNALLDLQSKFNLESFEKEMLEIEMLQELKGIKQ